jgi:hypothetical protein
VQVAGAGAGDEESGGERESERARSEEEEGVQSPAKGVGRFISQLSIIIIYIKKKRKPGGSSKAVQSQFSVASSHRCSVVHLACKL